MLKKRGVNFLLLCIGAAGVWLWFRSPEEFGSPRPTSSSNHSPTITTVVSVPFGDKPGQISRLTPIPRFWRDYSTMTALMPVDVRTDGNIILLDHPQLLMFDAEGKMIRQVKCSWASHLAHHLRWGSEEAIWVIDNVGRNLSWPRLVKADIDGNGLWEIGSSIAGPSYSQRTIPALPAPPKPPTEGDILDAVGGLFTSANGDVFVLASDPVMRRFSSDGELLFSYHLEDGGFFSAFANRDGHVYNMGRKLLEFDNKSGYRISKGFRLYYWPEVGEPKTRIVDLGAHMLKNRVEGGEVHIVGNDDSGNLYLQYRYKLEKIEPANEIAWFGPMAIAGVRPDGQATTLLDLYRLYHVEINTAEQRANETRMERGPIGLGDVVHVAENGDLYLEVADATHYRIDKISLAE